MKKIVTLLTKNFAGEIIPRIYNEEDGRINIAKYEEIISELERISHIRNNLQPSVSDDKIHRKYIPDK